MVKDVESAEILKTFQSIGLSESKSRETIKNHAITQNLLQAIEEAKKNGPISPSTSVLLYHLASKIKAQVVKDISLLVNYITSEKIDTIVRLDVALDWLLTNVNNAFDEKAFEAACGVGVTVTPEQIEQCVEHNLVKYKEELIHQRYHFNVGLVMQEVRKELKWADGKAIKNEVDLQILDLLGPKTDEDKKPLPKPSKESSEKLKGSKLSKNASNNLKNDENYQYDTIGELMKNKVHFHKVGENYKTDGYVVTSATMELIKEHLKITGGKVRTRFPPEPNGILHIGHAKAININFGYAKAYDGECFLRFDDTNPEKEEEKFFTGIKDMVEWLGYKPHKITHSSDYFDELYNLAVQLIKKGFAYVCHQRSEDIKGFNPPPSPWRNRSIEENLQLFEDMKNGKFDEGEAILRMKVTLEEGKQDPVAYRIKFLPHHRTGDKWCIYPTYDYTHCLCDSIENITHSLCTKEFQSRRSSYYWLCNALGIYCPVQWEFGRLSVNYTVTSKRKIAKLISEGIVRDWDDPRLYTLTALRRRGFPPEAINNFCSLMGVTGASAAVDPHILESCARDILNVTAPRHMVVLEPLKVTIENFPENGAIKVNVPNFPNDTAKGFHTVQFNRVIYIEQNDFREAKEDRYRRLTNEQSVGLRHAGFIISLKEVIKNSNGEVVELRVTCESSASASLKPKAYIHWVSDPIKVYIRVYDLLFHHKNPDDLTEVPDGFLSDVNRNSLHEFESLADLSIKSCKHLDNFQFERIGFFSVDPDTNKSKIIFNQTVSLKEDAGKE